MTAGHRTSDSPQGGRSRLSPIRVLITALLILQLAWSEFTIVRTGVVHDTLGRAALSALLAAIVLGGAIVVIAWRDRFRSRWFTTVVLSIGVLYAARFHAVREIVAYNTRHDRLRDEAPRPVVQELTSYLRQLASAEEQYRLQHHIYSSATDSLNSGAISDWGALPGGFSVEIDAHGDTGWFASASADSVTCTIWVRDTTLRNSSAEGAPVCSEPVYREKNQIVRTRSAHTPVHERGFRADEILGTWLQHRGNAKHTGRAVVGKFNGAYRWNAQVGGEIIASAAVAGNQVFVGAHGNGEFSALTLDSGVVGYRLRVPNWIHHDPVVTDAFVAIDFGNNERDLFPTPSLGSQPSGIAVFDRRTGAHRWHRYVSGSLMTSPVVFDSLIVVTTSAREAIAWRLQDGSEVWRARLPGMTPMGNPMLMDSTLFIGLELSRLCALDVRTGARRYCVSHPSRGFGAGHTTVSIAGNILLQTFDQGVAASDAALDGWWREFAVRILRLPVKPLIGEQVLIGANASDGRELWRVRLGIGKEYRTKGHQAGTPVVVNAVAYVASPISGRVIAVRADSGIQLWSTAVNTARGSVLVTDDAVLVATLDTTLVVLDRSSGQPRCHQRLPGLSDRAGPTLAGATAILTFRSGLVMARPLAEFLTCSAQ